MKKILITTLLLASINCFSQSSQKENKVDSVALWNKHLDSVMSRTTIKDFQVWLYENATVKQYQESKFVDLYNAFVQFQLQLWLQPKNKLK